MHIEIDKDICHRDVIVAMRPDYPARVEWIEQITPAHMRPGTLVLLRLPYEGFDVLSAALQSPVPNPTELLPEPCHWRADCEGTWAADCGLLWCLEYEPLPSQHQMRFCPGCGKRLEEHPYVEPPVCWECGEELEDGACPEGCPQEANHE